MLPNSINIVFDRQPPSASGKYTLRLHTPYKAKRVNDLGLYSLTDDKGVPFNVSTFGRSYTNSDCWHILDDAGELI